MPAFMDSPGLYGFSPFGGGGGLGPSGYSGPRATGATALRLAQSQQQRQQVAAALQADPLEQYKQQLQQRRAGQASLASQIIQEDAADAVIRRRKLVESLFNPGIFGAYYPPDFIRNYARQLQYTDQELAAKQLQAALSGEEQHMTVGVPVSAGAPPQTVDAFAKMLGAGYGHDIDPLALSIRQRE